MKLIIENRTYKLTHFELLRVNRDGEYYQYKEEFVVKIYKQLNGIKKQKILALCNSYSNMSNSVLRNCTAFPQYPVYYEKVGFAHLVGFSMCHFGNSPTLHQVGYDLKLRSFKDYSNSSIDQHTAIDLIYQLFECLDQLHKARIILGGLTPNDILYNTITDQPLLINLDNVQIGPFECDTYSPDYMDPYVEQQGRALTDAELRHIENSLSEGTILLHKYKGSSSDRIATTHTKPYLFNYENDIFSIACITYEFIVGAHPFFVVTEPKTKVDKNKRSGISNLRCFLEGPSYLTKMNINYLDVYANKSIMERIDTLKRTNQKLFDFFVSTFLKGNRRILL